MDTSDQASLGVGGADVAGRRTRTNEEKRWIVEEALVPGVSVAAVARRHGVNANLLFGWRRLHKQGLLERSREPAVPLLPVHVTSPTVVAERRSTDVTRSSSRLRHKSVTAPRPSRELGPIDLDGLEVIALDEFAIHKGHRYAKVIVEPSRKRVLWIGRGRGRKATRSGIPSLVRFAQRLRPYLPGILAHCRYPLGTNLFEGINNKIKVIKRMAYGFRDDAYFFLKIRAAFPGVGR